MLAAVSGTGLVDQPAHESDGLLALELLFTC
jgi:hypothetical protein